MKMTFKEIAALENELHRSLTDDEAMLGYNKGRGELLQSIGLDEVKLRAYNQVIDLLVTYCTKGEFDFIKAIESKDYKEAIELLQDFVNDVILSEEDKKKDFVFDDTPEPEKEEMEKDLFLFNKYLKSISDMEYSNKCLSEYNKFDPEHVLVLQRIRDLRKDDVIYSMDDMFAILDNFIEKSAMCNIAENLAKTEEYTEMEPWLIHAVCRYIESNWTNYSLIVVNNKIQARRKKN